MKNEFVNFFPKGYKKKHPSHRAIGWKRDKGEHNISSTNLASKNVYYCRKQKEPSYKWDPADKGDVSCWSITVQNEPLKLGLQSINHCQINLTDVFIFNKRKCDIAWPIAQVISPLHFHSQGLFNFLLKHHRKYKS